MGLHCTTTVKNCDIVVKDLRHQQQLNTDGDLRFYRFKECGPVRDIIMSSKRTCMSSLVEVEHTF